MRGEGSAKIRRWLYRRCGRLQGPLTFEDLRAAAYLGFLKPDDLVRDPRTETWVEARTLPALQEVLRAGPDSLRSDGSAESIDSR